MASSGSTTSGAQPFDWVFYTNFYKDIKSSDLKTKEQALQHYNTNGKAEHRRKNINIERFMKNSDETGETIFGTITLSSFNLINHHFIEYLNETKCVDQSTKILETGCGIACHSLPIIKKLGNQDLPQYFGIDTDEMSINWCQRNIASVTGNITTFKTLNSWEQNLPYDNATFDVVMTGTTCINIKSDQILEKYFIEISRVLKKGGNLFLLLLIWPKELLPLSSKNGKNSKILFQRTNTQTMARNALDEQAVVYNDTDIVTRFEKNGFELREINFGHWNGASKSNILHDVIRLVKK